MLLAACGGGAPIQSGLFFPTWDPGDAVPTGIVQGVLVEDDRCLFVEAHGVRTLVVWEEWMGFADGSLLDAGGEPIARVGDVVHGGGGYHSDRAHIEGIVGREIPDRCMPAGDEPFALVYEVEAGSFE